MLSILFLYNDTAGRSLDGDGREFDEFEAEDSVMSPGLFADMTVNATCHLSHWMAMDTSGEPEQVRNQRDEICRAVIQCCIDPIIKVDIVLSSATNM